MNNVGQRFHLTGMVLTTLLLIVASLLHALPWIVPHLGWLGPLGIAAGLVLATRTPTLASYLLTLAWSTVAISIAFHWSPQAMAYCVKAELPVGIVIATPLLLWDAIRLSLGYWLASWITRDLRWNWLPAALVTILLEHTLPSVFPWKLGFMLLEWPWWLQAVDTFGASYSTFIVFAMAGLVINLGMFFGLPRAAANTTSQATTNTSAHGHYPFFVRWWPSLIPLAVLTLNAGYSRWAVAHWTELASRAKSLRVGLIQVDPSFQVSIKKLQAYTAEVADQVDLVCWPESSGGNYEMGLISLADEELVFLHSRDPERGLRPWPNPKRQLLMAGKNYLGNPDDPEVLHVTAMLVDCHEEIVSRYHKQHLMPFGEYVPYEDTIPGLKELFSMAQNITPGDGSNVLASPVGARLGVMLCYEDMVPEVARAAVAKGSDVLVSLINGASFDSPYTLWQHRMLSQIRALETRRYFLRCAATGETCIISPLGSIDSRLPVQQEGTLIGSVKRLTPLTKFVRFPHFATLAASLGLFGLVCNQMRTRRRSN
jgi:apolipoprotein N-acyltransferase